MADRDSIKPNFFGEGKGNAEKGLAPKLDAGFVAGDKDDTKDFNSASIDEIVAAVRSFQEEANRQGKGYGGYSEWTSRVSSMADADKRMKVVEALFNAGLWSSEDLAGDITYIIGVNRRSSVTYDRAGWEDVIDKFNHLKKLAGLDFPDPGLCRSGSILLSTLLDLVEYPKFLTEKIKVFARELVENSPDGLPRKQDIINKILK